MRIAVACAGNRHVDGEDQRLRAGGSCGRDQILHERAIAKDIELEPEWIGDCRDLSDRADRYGRKAGRYAGGFRRARRLQFSTPRVHAADPDRAERNGQGDCPAEQGGGQIDRCDVPKNALTQRDAGKVTDVAAQGLFGIGAAVSVLEQEARQAPPGGVAEIARRRDRHAMLQPPSMMCSAPVVYALSSDARCSARAAISVAVPMRPMGWRATKAARAAASSPVAARRESSEGDCTVPGQMTLQRMPSAT